MPVLLTVALLFISITLSIPCLLDSVSVLTRNYSIEEISLQEEQLGRTAIQADNQTFHYNPAQFTFKAGQIYRITYTPRSRFIIDIMEMTD